MGPGKVELGVGVVVVVDATVVDFTVGRVTVVVVAVVVGTLKVVGLSFGLKGSRFCGKGGGRGLLGLFIFLIFSGLSGTGAVRESSSSYRSWSASALKVEEACVVVSALSDTFLSDALYPEIQKVSD